MGMPVATIGRIALRTAGCMSMVGIMVGVRGVVF